MKSIESILAEADEAARQAKEDGVEPYVFDTKPSLFNPYPFPYLGHYIPDGWEMTTHYMVDATGVGAPDEPAKTLQQMHDHVVGTIENDPETGFAVIEVGMFQVVVAEYKRVPDVAA